MLPRGAWTIILFLTSAFLSLAAVAQSIFHPVSEGANWSGSNFVLQALVLAGAVCWATALREKTRRLPGLWALLFPHALFLYVTLVMCAFMGLATAGAITQLLGLSWAFNSGALTFLLAYLPTASSCFKMLDSPTASFSCPVILAFYLAVGYLWAENIFITTPVTPSPTPSTITRRRRGAAVADRPYSGPTTSQSPQRFRLSNDYTTDPSPVPLPESTPQSTVTPSSGVSAADPNPDINTTPIPTSAPTNNPPRTSAGPQYTSTSSVAPDTPSDNATPPPSTPDSIPRQTSGIRLDRTVSDTPMLGPVLPRGISLNVKVLSNTPLLSGGGSQSGSRATEAVVQLDKLNNTGANVDSGAKAAAQRLEGVVRGGSYLSGRSSHLRKSSTLGGADMGAFDTQVVSGNADDDIEDDATLSKEESHVRQSFLFGGFGAAMDVEVVAEDQHQIPAVHAGRAARRSSSLKLGAQAAWDKVVLLPVRHTKKSFASAAETMRKASMRRTSSIGADSTTPTSPRGNPPSRTSSLKKTVSNLGNRLAPANCLGRSAVRG